MKKMFEEEIIQSEIDFSATFINGKLIRGLFDLFHQVNLSLYIVFKRKQIIFYCPRNKYGVCIASKINTRYLTNYECHRETNFVFSPSQMSNAFKGITVSDAITFYKFSDETDIRCTLSFKGGSMSSIHVDSVEPDGDQLTDLEDYLSPIDDEPNCTIGVEEFCKFFPSTKITSSIKLYESGCRVTFTDMFTQTNDRGNVFGDSKMEISICRNTVNIISKMKSINKTGVVLLFQFIEDDKSNLILQTRIGDFGFVRIFIGESELEMSQD